MAGALGPVWAARGGLKGRPAVSREVSDPAPEGPGDVNIDVTASIHVPSKGPRRGQGGI